MSTIDAHGDVSHR